MTERLRAVLDIGTNTALMLVASRRPDGQVVARTDEAIITKLGRGADATGRLRPEAIAATLEALRLHRETATRLGASDIVAVATESLRMAENRDDFLGPARTILGVPIRMISGEEEARLSYLSVARETPGTSALRVVDIGGGSTELVVGHGEEVESIVSHRIGSVRLTERHGEDVAAIEEAAREALRTQPVAPGTTLHALAGTATTTAALLLGLAHYDRDAVDGSTFPRTEVEALRDAVAAETLAQRTRRPCLPEGRADVIVAGITILLAVMDHCGADSLTVRDRGLRYALV